MRSRDMTATVLTSTLVAGITTLAILGHYAPKTPTKQQVGKPRKPGAMIVHAKVTAYCPCVKCCGQYANGKTSRGRDAWRTRGVSVDPRRIKYGSFITIPGAGTFIADDTGSTMRNALGHHIDLRFSTHQEALDWGVKELDVEIK